MSYSLFTLPSVKRAFNLQTQESRDVFANIPQVEISTWLKQTYDYGLDVAIASSSEKARSEMIIAPMLLELKKQASGINLDLAPGSYCENRSRKSLFFRRVRSVHQPLLRRCKMSVNLFSGVDFNVDEERGLNGVCDFLITASQETLAVEIPLLVVVEAKKENITGGLGQCIAEMYAAKLFNERDEVRLAAIYGVVTTGSIWKFLRLAKSEVIIDTAEYFINDPGKIMGILLNFVVSSKDPE